MAEEKTRVVKVLVSDQEGKFLMLKNSNKNGWMSEKWEQPGGKIEDGEDRFEAARRELEEETNLEIGELEDLVRLEIEDDEILECFVLYTDRFSGEVELGKEHKDWKWITKEEALELEWHRDAAYIIPVIDYIDEYRKSEKNYGEGEYIKVVKLLIRNEEGEFLAMRKTAEDKIHSGHNYTLYGRMAGKWELPGGRFKGRKDRYEAARKEILEEVSIELGEIKDVMREEIEEKNDVDTLILFCDEWNGKIKLSKEHNAYRWVTPREYLHLNWHQDAGYGYPPMKWLEDYLN